MARLRFAALLLGAAVCLVGGLAAIFVTAVASALSIIGFGVALAGAAFLAREPETPEVTVTTGAIEAHGRTFTGLVIRFPRGRQRLALVIAGGFVVSGIGLALDGRVLLGVVTAAVFGLAGVAALVALRRGPGALVLGEEELAHIAAGGRASVRWDDVTSIERRSVRSAPLLRIHSDTGPELAGGPAEALGVLTRSRTFDIALNAVGVDPDRLQALLERCVSVPAARRRIAAGEVDLG